MLPENPLEEGSVLSAWAKELKVLSSVLRVVIVWERKGHKSKSL